MTAYSTHAPVSGQVRMNDISTWNAEQRANATSITPISGQQRNFNLANTRSSLCHPTGNDFRLGKFHGHTGQVNPYGSTKVPTIGGSGFMESNNNVHLDQDNRRLFPDAFFSVNLHDVWDSLNTTTGEFRFGTSRSARSDVDVGLDYVATVKPNPSSTGKSCTLTFDYLIDTDVAYTYIRANVIHRLYQGTPFSATYTDDLSQGLTPNGQWNSFSTTFNTAGASWDWGVLVFNLVFTDFSFLARGYYRMAVRNMRLTRTQA